jgi:hypothetical protein
MDQPLDMDSLEEIGKTSFTAAFQEGQFYFPKVLYGVVGGPIKIVMYESDFDLFVEVCRDAAKAGALEFIAHTTDSYWFNAQADPETLKRIMAGETSPTELFENDHPNAFEALSMTMVDKDGVKYARTCPYKRQGYGLVWLDPIKGEATETAGRYIDAMTAAIEASYAGVNENAGG